MSSSSLVRWGGLEAMLGGALFVLGGALFVVSALLIASMPRGYIGDVFVLRPMREPGLAGGLLMLALLLVVVGAVGLVIRVLNTGRFGELAKAGVVVAAVGATLPVISGLVQGVFFDGSYPLMPFFVIPGVLALVVGIVLLGLAVLRASVLPRWAAVLLVVGSPAMLEFNDQNAQALMAIPNGIAWMAAGYLLWSGEGKPVRQPARKS